MVDQQSYFDDGLKDRGVSIDDRKKRVQEYLEFKAKVKALCAEYDFHILDHSENDSGPWVWDPRFHTTAENEVNFNGD